MGTTGVVIFKTLTPVPMMNDVGPVHGTATLKRLIMSFHAYQESFVNNVPQLFAVASYVTGFQAVADLAIALPLSAAAVERDWHYWTFQSTYKDNVDEQGHTSWEVDIRTQRRLRAGGEYVLVVEPVSSNGSDIELVVGVRALWAISN